MIFCIALPGSALLWVLQHSQVPSPSSEALLGRGAWPGGCSTRSSLQGCMLSARGSHVQRSAPMGSMGICHVPAPAFIHRSLPCTPNTVRAETWQLALPGMGHQERGCGATSVRAVALAQAGNAGSTSGFLNSGCAAGSLRRTQMLMCSWARARR